jgi:23S rRNA (uracil1939-C5)-methyltransferase
VTAGTETTVTIESLAAGGAGVGHLSDGIAVFVPRAAPGDRVRLAAVRRRRRHAEAHLAAVLAPGPDRVEPPCQHFTRDRCGGCQWQHLSASAQERAKRRIVGDALRRIAGLDVPDPPLIPSPRAFGYRTSMTLTVRREAARVYAGFHDAFAPDRVFPLERCAIARDELNRLWSAIAGTLDGLPPGDDVRLRLRLTPAGALHLLVSGGARAFTNGAMLARAAQAAGCDVTVWWQPAGGAPRRVGGLGADAAGVAFGQVNAEVAASLHAAVVEEADRNAPQPRGRLLDLYAGAGETAIPLAQRGWDVALVEVDRRAVRRAAARAEETGRAVRCVAGRVEEHLERLLPADVIVANPPRAGLAEVVTALLVAAPPRRLVYVSCDPATLARDLRRLGARPGRLATVRAYDMFPQTSHVETLVVLEAP